MRWPRVLKRCQPEALEQRTGPRARLRPRRPAVLHGNRGVVQSSPPRQQQVTLRHKRATGKPLPRRGSALDEDQPRVWLKETGDDLEEGSFAPSAGPDDSHPRFSGNAQADARQGAHLAECLPHLTEVDSEGPAVFTTALSSPYAGITRSGSDGRRRGPCRQPPSQPGQPELPCGCSLTLPPGQPAPPGTAPR